MLQHEGVNLRSIDSQTLLKVRNSLRKSSPPTPEGRKLRATLLRRCTGILRDRWDDPEYK